MNFHESFRGGVSKIQGFRGFQGNFKWAFTAFK